MTTAWSSGPGTLSSSEEEQALDETQNESPQNTTLGSLTWNAAEQPWQGTGPAPESPGKPRVHLALEPAVVHSHVR